MPTNAERYFQEQVVHALNGDELVASAYFRTHIKDRGGRAAMSTFVDASRARGFYLALTPTRLLCVETRAPATSSPLLENKGLTSIPLADVNRVVVESDLLLIESNERIFSLQMATKNKAFPQQGAFIEQLIERFDVSASLDTIHRAQWQKRAFKLALIGAAIAGGILWGILK